MLLEREKAVQQFNDAVSNISQSGGIVLLSGEAGIGKTSLLESLYASLRSQHLVLWSGCDPLFSPRPYGPLYDFAEALSPSLLSLLKIGAPPSEIFARFYSTLELLDKPAILIIEDAHWADHATLDCLKYISRRIAFLPCLLCISYRDDEVDLRHALSSVLQVLPSAHVTRIGLEPLSQQAINILAEGTQYNSIDLYRITSGNPFFVAELLANTRTDDLPVPASIRDAVIVRLLNLSENERALLETLCLIPYAIPNKLIEHIFGTRSDKLVMACIARNLLQSGTHGEIKFRHELARLATLESVSAIQQERRHADILQALEELGQTENLAWLVHHAEGALDDNKILLYAPAAARKAADLGAHKEAAAFYGKALIFVDKAEPELAAQLYESWAYEVGLTTHLEKSVIAARVRAIALYKGLGREEKVGENLRYLSRLYWYQGQAAKAEQFANEAIEIYESVPASAERAIAYSMRSQLDILNGRTDDAIKWGNKALELEQRFNNPEVKVHALNNVGTALMMRGDTRGEAMLMESLSLAQKHALHEDAARAYTNYSDCCLRFKRLAQAETVISQGIAFDVSNDLDSWTYYLVGLQASLRLEQGRFIDAETIASGVQALTRQTLLMKLPSLLVLALIKARIADPSGEALLLRALRDAQATGELQYIIPASFAFIEFAWLTDRLQDAYPHLHRLSTLEPENFNCWQLGELHTWLLRCLYPANLTLGIPLPAPHALELKGYFFEAADAWLALGIPYNAAICLLQVIDENIQQAYIKANALFESMQAKAAIGLLRKRSTQLGFINKLPAAKRGPYKKARQHPTGLTAKEQLILKYIANGRSNHEIAKLLSRSHRTIENHVSAVLQKLGVANRIEAMLRVQSEPWLVP